MSVASCGHYVLINPACTSNFKDAAVIVLCCIFYCYDGSMKKCIMLICEVCCALLVRLFGREAVQLCPRNKMFLVHINICILETFICAKLNSQIFWISN